MTQMRRFLIDPSCVFAESLGDLQYIRDNHTVVGKSTIVNSPFGRAMRFSITGGSDAIVIGDFFDIGLNDMTVIARVKTTVAFQSGIMSKNNAGGGADDQWKFWMQSADIYGYFRSAGTDRFNGAFGCATVNDGIYHTVAMTLDRDGDAIGYVDGIAGGTTYDISAGSGDTFDSPDDLTIGATDEGAANGMEGDMGDILLYKRLLSLKEILNIATLKVW